MQQKHTPWAEAKGFFWIFLFASYEQQSFVFGCVLYFIVHDQSINSYLFSLAFEGYRRLCLSTGTESDTSEHSPSFFDITLCMRVCVCVFRCIVWEWEVGEKKKDTHYTHMHSIVWYLLSPLLTAAHKKFTESPPFCFHQHITLSSYYANEITAL